MHILRTCCYCPLGWDFEMGGVGPVQGAPPAEPLKKAGCLGQPVRVAEIAVHISAGLIFPLSSSLSFIHDIQGGNEVTERH